MFTSQAQPFPYNIISLLEKQMPRKSPKSKAKKQLDFAKLDIDEQVRLINAALEPEVYPALQMDGGGLEIMDIQGYEVHIQYYGACGNCSIGTTATLPFIEQTLQTQVDPRIKVVLVSTSNKDY